jgi:DnaJ-class molecular chaperone
MELKNYYKLLGVDRTATFEDIKKSYKRLLLLYHPDKPTGNRQMFDDIQMAYEILSNPQKRHIYDSTLVYEEEPSLLHDFFMTMLDVLHTQVNMTKDATKDKHTTKKNATTKSSTKKNEFDIVLRLQVTLDEIYNEEVKKVVAKVKRNGDWKNETLYVNLIDVQPQYIYKNLGDDNKGDIIIRLDIQKHPIINRLDNDLYISEKVNLYEYIYGCHKIIHFLDHQTLEITVPSLYKHNNGFKASFINVYKHTFESYGLPRHENGKICYGNLYVCFDLYIGFTKDIYLQEVQEVIKTYFNSIENGYGHVNGQC